MNFFLQVFYRFFGYDFFKSKELIYLENRILEQVDLYVKSHQKIPRIRYSVVPADPAAERRRRQKELKSFMEKNKTDGFSVNVLRLAKEKGKTYPEIYKAAHIDRKVFSKLKNDVNYSPSFETAVAIAIGLELNLEETKNLLSKARYSLSHSYDRDLVLEYLISEGIYDMDIINDILYKYTGFILED